MDCAGHSTRSPGSDPQPTRRPPRISRTAFAGPSEVIGLVSKGLAMAATLMMLAVPSMNMHVERQRRVLHPEGHRLLGGIEEQHAFIGHRNVRGTSAPASLFRRIGDFRREFIGAAPGMDQNRHLPRRGRRAGDDKRRASPQQETFQNGQNASRMSSPITVQLTSHGTRRQAGPALLDLSAPVDKM